MRNPWLDIPSADYIAHMNLTLRAQDLADCRLPDEAFDLAHGALLFEYLEWPALLPRLARTLRTGGGLSVVLQRPSEALPAVTRARFMSLRRLEPLFHFVEPDTVVAQARGLRLEVQKQWTEELKSGKALPALHFRKREGPGTSVIAEPEEGTSCASTNASGAPVSRAATSTMTATSFRP